MAVPGDPSLSRMWGCRGWSEQKGCCNPELDPCHPQSKALRERWLLEGTPSSASEGDEDMRRQMQEDEQKSRLLEESISRWAGRAPARVWAGSPEEGLCGPRGGAFGHLARWWRWREQGDLSTRVGGRGATLLLRWW